MGGLICLNLHTTFSPGLLQTSVLYVVLYVDMEPTSLAVGLLRNAGEKAGAASSQSEDKLRRCAALPSSPLPSHWLLFVKRLLLSSLQGDWRAACLLMSQ